MKTELHDKCKPIILNDIGLWAQTQCLQSQHQWWYWGVLVPMEWANCISMMVPARWFLFQGCVCLFQQTNAKLICVVSQQAWEQGWLASSPHLHLTENVCCILKGKKTTETSDCWAAEVKYQWFYNFQQLLWVGKREKVVKHFYLFLLIPVNHNKKKKRRLFH